MPPLAPSPRHLGVAEPITLYEPDAMRYYVTLAGRTIEVDLSGPTPRVDGVAVRAELVAVPDSPVRHLLVDDRAYALLALVGDRRGRWTVEIGGERLTVDVVDERTRSIRELTGDDDDPADRVLVAPMPGLVIKVEVEVGDTVRQGQGIVIVEAMKMENELKAPADGVVARIEAVPGQTVEKGATLLVLE